VSISTVSADAIEERENAREADFVAETWGNASNDAWKPTTQNTLEPSEDG
jgi:hypothetical protein